MATDVKNLNEKAMLVYLKISMWSGKTKDTKVSKEVVVNKQARLDAGGWWTNLVPPKRIRPIDNAVANCRATHHKYTLPWMDGGLRVLPSAMFLEYSKAMREANERFHDAVKQFLTEYPDLLKDARERLGKLKDTVDLPTVESVKRRFAISQDILPMPAADDFRVDLGKDETEAMKQNITHNIANMCETAMRDLWSRFGELLEKVETTMSQRDKKFKNSLMNNLKDFCNLIPKLNIIEDSTLEELRTEALEKLTTIDPDVVRGSRNERKKVHNDVKSIVDKMNAYMGK